MAKDTASRIKVLVVGSLDPEQERRYGDTIHFHVSPKQGAWRRVAIVFKKR